MSATTQWARRVSTYSRFLAIVMQDLEWFERMWAATELLTTNGEER